MAARELHLDQLINASDLRDKLTALTRDHDGDGSSAKTRAEALALFKEAYHHARAGAETMLAEDGGGLLCATRLSRVQDELIRCIYDFALVHVFRVPNLTEGERIAVLAVGGYGRGTLAPGSDIDLLFLLPHKKTALAESLIEYILYMLWDMGFKVGHATRSLDECIRLSKDDITIRTAVLEARFLWGHEPLFEELVQRFDKEIVSKTGPEFIKAKLAERDSRHQKSGRSRYLVEPNIKDGKGGQRDLHTLFWISKYFYRLRTQDQLRKAEVFSKEDFRTFTRAQDFLWAVRCHLHFHAGRAEERLSFDVQPVLAARLGYQDHPGQSAVERFMKHYFLVAKDVGDLTRILCSKLEEEQAKEATGIMGGVLLSISGKNRRRKIKGSTEFVSMNNRIAPVDDEVFINNPAALLTMFRIAEENGLLFHPDAMQLAKRSLKLIKASLRKDPQANKDFLAVLTSPLTPERTLRKMNECGVLGRFIPEFGKVVAMMQFNMYHHYTVDEHLLRSIGILSEIEHGDLEDEHPLANEIMDGGFSRTELYVALLLHDIAKGRPEDHSVAGAKVAKKLCPRFGLDEEQTELVSWLVEQHLAMSTIAQSRDLNDPRTISDFAKIMQSVERMKALLVLTVCDIKAVGPGVWNGWKGQLLRSLYHETEPLLTGGFTTTPRRERAARVRQELADALSDWDAKLVQSLIDLHYDNYLLTVPHDNQIRHLNFLKQTADNGESFATSVSTREFEAITEITIVAPDHPNLLSIVAGSCAAAGANIVDAQVFTMRDGRAFDSVFISRAFEADIDEHRRAERITELIEQTLAGERDLEKLLSERTHKSRKVCAFKVPPKVKIDNSLSDYFTVIQVEGRDRPGFLSDVSRIISEASLNIGSAHIATFGERVKDTFYVTDLVGHKIMRPARIDAIRAALLDGLSGKTPQPKLKKTA